MSLPLHTCCEFLSSACLNAACPVNLEAGSCCDIWVRLAVSASASPPLQTVKHLLDAPHALLELGQLLKHKTISLTSYNSARFPGVT